MRAGIIPTAMPIYLGLKLKLTSTDLLAINEPIATLLNG
jgi:hypothetical protein